MKQFGYKTLRWILWTFGCADASAASTWFGLRHVRRKVALIKPTVVSSFRFRDLGVFVFEFWVLRFRDFGVFVFEFWVLRFRDFGVFVFEIGCFVFEIWVLRFRVLGASCFGLRFRVLRFRNYNKLPEITTGNKHKVPCTVSVRFTQLWSEHNHSQFQE